MNLTQDYKKLSVFLKQVPLTKSGLVWGSKKCYYLKTFLLKAIRFVKSVCTIFSL